MELAEFIETTVEVTANDLDMAIANRGNPGYEVVKECVLAQASRRIMPQFTGCSSAGISDGIVLWKGSRPADDEAIRFLTNNFDVANYEVIRVALPMVIYLRGYLRESVK